MALRHALFRHQHGQHETRGCPRVSRRCQSQGKPVGAGRRLPREFDLDTGIDRRRLDGRRRDGHRRGYAQSPAAWHRPVGAGCPDVARRHTNRALARTHSAHLAEPMSSRFLKLRPGAAGFTLVEILVALLILAIMAGLGYSTYRAARISAERTEDSLKRSREIEFGMRIMVADFAQLVPRPVRDILGQSRLPALRGPPGAGSVTVTSASLGANSSGTSGTNSGMSFNSGVPPTPGMSFNAGSSFGSTTDANAVPMVDLTRAGWSNTAGQQRSTLQRVSYALVGDVLKRSYQINLNTLQVHKPVVQDLLTGVKGVQLRYLDSNQAWQNQWPESTTIQNGSTADWQSRPIAVEIIIQFKDWGAIRRLVEVSG